MSHDNNLTGALFKNAYKETETHPDYKGEAEVEGTQYWLNAWLNTSSKGRKYLSLKFKAKEKKNAPAAPVNAPAAPVDDFDDGAPF